MDRILQRLVTNSFSELPGLTVDATIPVPEELVNEILAITLRGNRNITYCRVSLHRDNRVNADVRSPLLPWTLHLKMKLFHAVDFTGSPKLRAFLENNLLLGKLGSLFHALPKGMTLYNNQIAMDVEMFTPPEHKHLLALVKSVDIQTEEGKVILKVKLEREPNLPAMLSKL
jgi:hypothetical protein